VDAVLVFIFLCFLAFAQISSWRQKHHLENASFLWAVFGLHFLLMAVYVTYAFATVSDSFEYYRAASVSSNWFDLWGTGTDFVNFLAWPFVRLLGLSYIGVMLVFSYLGFWAVGLFYFAVREQLGPLPKVIGDFSWLEIVWLLPNIHFWSSSLGKGPLALLGIALFAFGLSRYKTRVAFLAAGILLTYYLRPHVAFVMMGGTAIGVLFANRGVPWYVRLGIVFAAIIGAFFFFQQSTDFIAIKDGSNQSLDAFLTKRAAGLTNARSGLDYGNYNLVMKMFTFLFRPLFFDANGFMGLVVSFENAFYLYMLGYILWLGVPSFGKINGWYKACLFVFLLGALALSQVSANLGLAMRQKAQIMPLFFFLFLKVKELEFERENAYAAKAARKIMAGRLAQRNH
jgi:hypothetical protein